MIRKIEKSDKSWIREFIKEHWCSESVFVHGQLYRPHELPGFIAEKSGKKAGLITYLIKGTNCEIVTLNSVRSGKGTGTALVEAVKNAALEAGCRRLWLVTTNDNLNALGFYQKKGFVLVAVYRNALDLSRKFKPEIPLTGDNGIPLRDEIELEMDLTRLSYRRKPVSRFKHPPL